MKIVLKNIDEIECNYLLHIIKSNNENSFVNNMSEQIIGHTYFNDELILETNKDDINIEFAIHELTAFAFSDKNILKEIKKIFDTFDEKKKISLMKNVINEMNYEKEGNYLDIVRKNIQFIFGQKCDEYMKILYQECEELENDENAPIIPSIRHRYYTEHKSKI